MELLNYIRSMKIVPILLFFLMSCSSNNPQKIIDRAIEAAGGAKYLTARIEFDFRDRHYIANRNGGLFSYERLFTEPNDSTQKVHDILNNDGFTRAINGQAVAVPDSMSVRYSASVNSVLYFALLPYGLNDAAVRKKLLGETVLQGKKYFLIEVTFEQTGGGEDYQDVFYYWINQNDYRIDFLAYSFMENNEIGYRFRKAINSRVVNGILFQDYINYKPSGLETLDRLQRLYESGDLVELSKIELQNIIIR